MTRGDVSFERGDVPGDHRWRVDEELCLRHFVETIAKDRNEVADRYMLRYERSIREAMADAAERRAPIADRRAQRP